MEQRTLTGFGNSSQQRVEQALTDLQKGKGVLLIDNEDRENEGDLIYSAQHIQQEDMALMIRHCSGVVCLCLTDHKADELNLPYMVAENNSLFQTPFTISIEARKGVTTGLSAADRVQTIKAASARNAKPEDLARPGHIFPLRARERGVLERNGHTEGSIDLMLLAGLEPQAVLCELMNDDGSMARLPQIIRFAITHGLTVLSIEDIIFYRSFVCDYTDK
ncbi:3,4-dihydroxy-2-butanone-4-phosphate synthase [Sphingobacterium spiritivorum]|uniref:3,4-dihydroxy-2-butanone-4-phosphate synthase n=1 Tax=Sphingobacterium spiritivorum TaxID=258 RepID=UPI003DA60002